MSAKWLLWPYTKAPRDCHSELSVIIKGTVKVKIKFRTIDRGRHAREPRIGAGFPRELGGSRGAVKKLVSWRKGALEQQRDERHREECFGAKLESRQRFADQGFRRCDCLNDSDFFSFKCQVYEIVTEIRNRQCSVTWLRLAKRNNIWIKSSLWRNSVFWEKKIVYLL